MSSIPRDIDWARQNWRVLWSICQRIFFLTVDEQLLLSFSQDHDHRVAETAVVGYPHEIFGEGTVVVVSSETLSLPTCSLFGGTGVYAFVILKDGVTDSEEVVKEDLKKLIKTQIGSFAVPQGFLVSWVDKLYDDQDFSPFIS